MQHRNLQSWLNYLETLHPKSIDMGLDRVCEVAKRLNLLPYPIPTITVGGTNGKGSCVAALSQIYHAQGYRVGAYTSPHLLAFNERIQLNQQFASDEQICHAFTQIDTARKEISLSYFEFATLAALLIFHQARLDVVILEVGLGGRLDAVNIVDTDCALITTIDFDHMDYLGDTLDAIAAEKAGILRADKPAVCGLAKPPQTLVQYAERLGAPLFVLGKDFDYKISAANFIWHNQLQQFEFSKPLILPANAACVLQVIDLMQAELPVTKQSMQQGLSQAICPGRMQVFERPRLTILDIAHNPQAVKTLMGYLEQHPCHGKTIAVFAMLKDKDIPRVIEISKQQINCWCVAQIAHLRAASNIEITQKLQAAGMNADVIIEAQSPVAAYQQAISMAAPRDRIIVFGSFYLIGPIYKKLVYNLDISSFVG